MNENLFESITKEIITNSEIIIDKLDYESIEAYCFILETFKTSDSISNNFFFRFVYKSFYKFERAGLSDQFYTKYFKTMDEYKASPDKVFDLKELLEKFYEIKIKGKIDRNSLQFSFITKLLHTINNENPIYDSNVASVFGYKEIYNKEMLQKITCYEERYEEIKWFYNEIIKRNLFNSILNKFDKKFNKSELSQVMKLDFIFWQYGKIKNKKEDIGLASAIDEGRKSGYVDEKTIMHTLDNLK